MAKLQIIKREQELEEEVQDLKNILNVAGVVVSSLELDSVLNSILTNAMAIMEMPAGSIALYEEEQNTVTLHAHAGLSAVFVGRSSWTVEAGGLTDRILRQGEQIVVADTREADFFNNPLALAEGIRSLIIAPLRIHDKIVGILYLDDFVPRTFSEKKLRLLTILASFATMSIDNARLHQRACELACTDGLTGLYNYRQFNKNFKDEMARAQRHKKPLSLIMYDIDDFKKFNDTFGHPSGDQALAVVARIMRESLRQCDLLYRYGGEEFVAILPETDFPAALVAAERSRRAIQEQTPNVLPEGCRRELTVSVGVATYPEDGRDRDQLLKVVDALLYTAKKYGKNKVYHPRKDAECPLKEF